MTDVVVTGLGLVTPGGLDVASAWASVREGRACATVRPDLAVARTPVTVACSVPDFDPDAELGRGTSRRLDRYTHLALLAARQALVESELAGGADGDGFQITAADPDRVGVLLGSGIGGADTWDQEYPRYLEHGPDRVSPMFIPRMLSNTAAGMIAMRTGARGPNLTVNTACAAGASALHVARDLIRAGAADVVLAGGAEAGITPLSISAFAKMGALSRNADLATASRPFDVDRDGFVMGEGAGILVLESADHARARGAGILARFAGAGASADAHHVTAPPEDGSGAQLAMRRALQDAELSPQDIGHVNAHGTSTPLNDAAEAHALTAVFGDHVDDLAVTSTKGSTGHLLGAAGAVEAAFAILSMRDAVVPPTAGLVNQDPALHLDVVHAGARPMSLRAVQSNSFGFGGQNASLVFVRDAAA